MRGWPLAALAALSAVAVAEAAPPDAALKAEVSRGFVAAGHRTSDEPAMRGERALHDPSAGFALGAALGAWINAADTLDYDLKTPSGDGDDSETIHLDCYDEILAMNHLEARRQGLALNPAQVLAAAGVTDKAILPAWTKRQAGANPGCH